MIYRISSHMIDSKQIFELGLGFQSRDESMDFKMATGEFARMKQNLKEAEKLNERMKVKEDFSLADDEVLEMKPMKKKKKKQKDEEKTNFGDDDNGFLPPPSDAKKTESKKKKKKKKKKKQKEDEKLFGDFTEANSNNNNDGGGDDGWATFD